ncbi:unnamed protein product [Phyllotreta striolata]|uniref:Glucuronosyltransferase n=1 Tax=Phyllotreta striolata TaxID=444603 RepID=A0A9N9TEF6_PHYSR|nr:unnamed protein product [Phyllotreta striolata]
MSSIKFFYIILSLVPAISASKILAIVSTPSYSHQISFQRIWISLAQKGHQVTLLTTNPINDPNLKTLREINTNSSYEIVHEYLDKVRDLPESQIVRFIARSLDEIMEQQLSLDPVVNLIRNESDYDVVICESLFFEMQAFADLYKCPKILISSFQPFNFHFQFLGSPSSPAANPSTELGFIGGVDTSFSNRFSSFVMSVLYTSIKHFVHFPQRHDLLKKHFGPNVRSPLEILRDTDLFIITSNHILNEIRPLGPNIVHLGGGLHLSPPKPLPKEIKEFLDSATEGFIYLSLGTNAKSMYLPNEEIQVIMEAFSELPYKVLWKLERQDILQIPKNVKIMSWIPQQDVLRHPNIKLFIMQGGLQSLEESILTHVPMVIMPGWMPDQVVNSRRMEHRGLARIIHHHPIPDKEEFKSVILDVINDPKYKENVVKTAELLLDQPMSAVDKAVWWIEYVIRHKGAKHLRIPSIDMPAYQFYCLDIIAVIIILVFISIWIFKKICSFIFQLFLMLIFSKKKRE